jgi:hypothetical protein
MVIKSGGSFLIHHGFFYIILVITSCRLKLLPNFWTGRWTVKSALIYCCLLWLPSQVWLEHAKISKIRKLIPSSRNLLEKPKDAQSQLANWLTNQQTNSMEQSPSWEANSHSANQEIPCLLWNPKVHYRVDKDPPLVPVLSHINSVHNFQLHFSQMVDKFPAFHWTRRLITVSHELGTVPYSQPDKFSHLTHTLSLGNSL